MLNLDTHILIALLKGELSEEERALVINARLVISDIVLWELAKLVQLGRLVLDLDSAVFSKCLQTLNIFPITLEIARTSTTLDFASDPVDEIIAATSIVGRVPLLTRDRRIRRSGIVPLAIQ